MSRLLLFNKPFGVLSQFTDNDNRPTLADFIREKGVYVAGRLDRDSEGLLLLTDDGQLQHRIAHPEKKMWKTYLVQVEGAQNPDAVQQLTGGVQLKDGPTRPAKVRIVAQPEWLWPRDPPVRYRMRVPDHWLEIKIREGRNRQVRRMTATVGLPTLRLIRTGIGHWSLHDLQPGQYRTETITNTKPDQQHAMDTQSHRRRRHRTR
ncbi:MAG: pseudouridine synthase [Chromatiales bacterium]